MVIRPQMWISVRPFPRKSYALNSVVFMTSKKCVTVHLPLATDIRDISANRHFTTNHNEITFRDNAAWFSGKATGIGLTNIDLRSRPFTIAMWINLTGEQLMYGLIEQRSAKRRHHWLHLMLRGSRQPYFGFHINDAISPRPIKANKWTHLVFSYDGEYQMMWIDGEPACARKAKSYRGGSKETLWIGKSPRWNNVPSYDFQGGMRDLRIYDRVLSMPEIYGLADRPFRQAASLGASGIPDPKNMPVSLNRARDGGVPYLFIDEGHLTITGETSQVYEIEATHKLGAAWESIGVMTNLTGTLEFDDPGFPRYPQRFYRIKFVGAR